MVPKEHGVLMPPEKAAMVTEQLCGCHQCLYCDIIGFEDVTRLTKLVDTAPSGSEIARVCLDVLEMLLEKNISYGNSALNPINIFSKASTGEQLNVRIDDKLNRLKNGSEYKDEDTVNDLIGYLLLHKVWLMRGHDEATGTNS